MTETCADCGRELTGELPANRRIPVTIGASVVSVCGACWRRIRPNNTEQTIE